MSKLYFYNDGEIDIRAAMIAGLSAKENTNTAIGYFGTGLKYAISSILRWGGGITIYSGTTKYTFTIDDIEFRDKSFQQIVIIKNDTDRFSLGFTTEYGKNWEPWQVFRELYANALDEGGIVSNKVMEPCAGYTTIVVDSMLVYNIFPIRNSIILPHNVAYDDTSSSVLISLSSANSIYYRGVRVHDDNCILTYNLLSSEVKLTEDRNLSNLYTARRLVTHAIKNSHNEMVITKFLMSEPGTFEDQCTIDSYSIYSNVFLEVASRLWKQSPRKYVKLRDFISATRPDLTEPSIVDITKIQQMQLDKAISLVSRMGIDPTEHNISVRDLGDGIFGQYNTNNGKIYLSPEVFRQGTKQVLSTLYEELIHAVTGKTDCNYDMQTFLFNQIVSLYEEHVFKEPI